MKIYPSTAETKLGFDVLRARLAGYTRSRLGEERVERMQPARQLDWLREELERVAELQEAFRFDDAVPLDHVLDLRDVLRRAAPEDAYVSPEDLAAVRYASNTVRRLRGYMLQRKEKYPRLAEAVQQTTALPELEQRIEDVVDEQTSGLKDNASPELRRLRRLLVQRRAQIRETLQDELRKAIGAGHATEDQPTIRNGRMVIPVRAEAKRKVQGFVQDTSATGQTVYIEPTAVLDLNNEVRELEGEERREVERILRAVTAHVRAHLNELHGNNRVLAQFDLLQAKAHLANELDAVVPHLNEDGILDIKAGRNPLLLLHFKQTNSKRGKGEDESGDREVVPLDLMLGDGYHTLVITGPNAGGKTVAMKTVGLFVLMLSYGLPVPCDEASSMCLFERMFVDIGDEQSIEEDLSTFSSHVSNLKQMLHRAGPQSLVLIDEAGTGTDPEQGGALAQAVLERLTDAGARTLVTTHLGALKAFAQQHEGVENGSMAFDQETLQPTYRFQAGIPGSSYAFEIAARIGLEKRVLARARELLGAQQVGLEELIATFEARNRALAEQIAETEETLRKTTQERTKYETHLEKIRRERDEIRQQALEEAERIVQGANARIEQTIREIKEAEAEREATKQARAKLEAFKEDVGQQQATLEKRQERRKKARTARSRRSAEPEANGSGPVRVGDQVVVDGGSTAAEVLEIDGGEAVVTAGPLRMRVTLDRLTKVGGPRKQQVTVRQTTSGSSDLAVMHARAELDVRGQRVEEALADVERLIDQAIAANLDRVEVLHGKGTGALRQAIHDYLAASPDVADFADAAWNQGGAGVTVVRLR